MVAFALILLLFLAMISYSDAVYCLCNAGASERELQTNIDYACGHADCSGILQNGACYNPNTVRDHCNFAVNSYYQRLGQAPGSCNFSGTASVSSTPPSDLAPGCVYLSTPSPGNTLSPPGGTGGNTFPAISPPAFLGPSSSTPNSSSTVGMHWIFHLFMAIVSTCFTQSGLKARLL